MNLLGIAQRVKAESGRSIGTPLATVAGVTGSDALIVAACQDAYRDIQNMPRGKWKWMWLQALGTLGVDNMVYPAAALNAPTWSYWKPESDDYRPSCFDPANAQTEWNLRFLDFDTFARRFLKGAHQDGAPQYWTVDNAGAFNVGPKPSLAYTLRADYFTVPQELVLDTDIPKMPDRFHMLIVWNALISVAISDNAAEKIAKGENMGSPLLDALILDQGERLRITARSLSHSYGNR